MECALLEPEETDTFIVPYSNELTKETVDAEADSENEAASEMEQTYMESLHYPHQNRNLQLDSASMIYSTSQ